MIHFFSNRVRALAIFAASAGFVGCGDVAAPGTENTNDDFGALEEALTRASIGQKFELSKSAFLKLTKEEAKAHVELKFESRTRAEVDQERPAPDAERPAPDAERPAPDDEERAERLAPDSDRPEPEGEQRPQRPLVAEISCESRCAMFARSVYARCMDIHDDHRACRFRAQTAFELCVEQRCGGDVEDDANGDDGADDEGPQCMPVEEICRLTCAGQDVEIADGCPQPRCACPDQEVLECKAECSAGARARISALCTDDRNQVDRECAERIFVGMRLCFERCEG